MKRIYYICNFQAGKAELSEHLGEIIDKMTKAGYEVTIHPTQAVQDATLAAEKAVNSGLYDYLFCSGGDGTLHEVMEGILKTEASIPVGYIPCGSVNDFARSMDISKDMLKACEDVLDGLPRKIDIGTVNERGFSYIAAFGAFTDIAYATPQNIKNMLGPAAYMLNAVTSLPNIRPYPMRITCDGEVIEDEFIFGMITNSASVGSVLDLNDFCFDDGSFEVTLIKKLAKPTDFKKVWTFLKDIHEVPESEQVYCVRASEIKVELLEETDVPWTIDGEYLPNASEFHIINHKQAVTFLVPRTCPTHRFQETFFLWKVQSE
ncbi:MAG: diacylglycerol kinase family lipid kinase [Oscillospiraceae bacterium]|nr:diacylglycerol kinase family lipid kinase [Oscillospiraceae bacterium]MBR7084429.1 diacylglycerol kinase family lipid kinase [Oscillospiraceae bacterium]